MKNEKPVDQQVASKPRLLYIDNLRILLTILVILHHLAIGYGAPGNVAYVEAGEISTVSTILMTLFVAINQSFFMGFFFMISSYFTPGSYDRKGPGPYVLDRLKRLGIPLLFYIIVIDPLFKFVLARYQGYPGSLGQFLRLYLQNMLDYKSLGVGPLWFVAVLLIFSLVYVLCRLVIRPQATPPPSEGKAPGNLAIAGFALILGLLTFLVRIWIAGNSVGPLCPIHRHVHRRHRGLPSQLVLGAICCPGQSVAADHHSPPRAVPRPVCSGGSAGWER